MLWCLVVTGLIEVRYGQVCAMYHPCVVRVVRKHGTVQARNLVRKKETVFFLSVIWTTCYPTLASAAVRTQWPDAAREERVNVQGPINKLQPDEMPHGGGGGGAGIDTRCSRRREERVTVRGPVKKPQPDGMSHGRGGGGVEGVLVTVRLVCFRVEGLPIASNRGPASCNRFSPLQSCFSMSSLEPGREDGYLEVQPGLA